MLKIIPYNKFEIVVPYSPENISKRIEGMTTITSRNLFMQKVYTPFTGHVYKDGFKISMSSFDVKSGMYKMDSFSPEIIGKYKSIETGTVVTVRERLTWPVILLSSVWTLGALITCWFMIMLWLSGEPFDMMFLIPFVMLAFVILFQKHYFWKNADEIRRILEQALL